jgi:RNA polymerase sigma-70 factor (ECF subfamily)
LGDHDQLAERFDSHRAHLRAVAYRMLGSLSEAEDAVQDAWLRLGHADARRIENLGGWLTTVVARLCLDRLRARASRHEQPLGLRPAGTAVDGGAHADPEQEALLADSVGLAMLVVLDRLTPAERLAFVLHDLFAVPFEEIAPIVERSPATTKKLGSRARRRVHGADTPTGADLTRQRLVVDAFLAAARGGDLEALLGLLDPDVVRRADRAALRAGQPAELRGARPVAEETRGNAPRARYARPALVNGSVGLVVAPRGRLLFALALAVEGEKITEIEVTADPARLARLDLAVLPG